MSRVPCNETPQYRKYEEEKKQMKEEAEKKRLEKNAKARARREEKKKKQGIFLLNLYFYESNINFNMCFFNSTTT